MNGRNTAYYGVNLVLDLNQKVLKFLVFLFNRSLYLSLFALEPLLMHTLYYSIVQLIWIFHAYWRRSSSCQNVCMLRQRYDFSYPFCGCLILCEKLFLAFRHTVFCREGILILYVNIIVAFTKNLNIYQIKLFFCLGVSKCCGWRYLLAWKTLCCSTWIA